MKEQIEKIGGTITNNEAEHTMGVYEFDYFGNKYAISPISVSGKNVVLQKKVGNRYTEVFRGSSYQWWRKLTKRDN